MFPLVFVKTLPWTLSDHTPLVMDISSDKIQKANIFIFELCWFFRPDLDEVVVKCWDKDGTGRSLLDKWQNRNRNLRRVLRGCNINYEASYKKEKRFLSEEIDAIDRESELVGLSAERYILRKDLESRSHCILREEEVK